MPGVGGVWYTRCSGQTVFVEKNYKAETYGTYTYIYIYIHLFLNIDTEKVVTFNITLPV